MGESSLGIIEFQLTESLRKPSLNLSWIQLGLGKMQQDPAPLKHLGWLYSYAPSSRVLRLPWDLEWMSAAKETF